MELRSPLRFLRAKRKNPFIGSIPVRDARDLRQAAAAPPMWQRVSASAAVKRVRPAWQPTRTALRRLTKSLRRPKVSRLAAAFGVGCLFAGALPNRALAPISPAYASIDRVTVESAPFGPGLPIAIVSSASFADRWGGTTEDEVGPVRFGSRDVPRQIVQTVVRAAMTTDVDPAYLMALADKESSFLPAIRARTSSAEGLYQFIDSTWLEMVKLFGQRHGLADEAAAIEVVDRKPVVADAGQRARILDLRRDPYVAAVLAAEMLKRDRAEIGFRIGRDLSPTELYLAHFLGPNDAARFMTLMDASGHQSAAAAFPAAARANRTIFFTRRGRRAKGMTVAAVFDRLGRAIESRVARFQSVMAFADARL